MLNALRRTACKRFDTGRHGIVSGVSFRGYHSYPDPNEVPVIKTSQPSSPKVYDKKSPEFQLDQKFKMDEIFPGVPVGKGIGSSPPPPTLYTTLANGLTVASQEMPGLMTSVALIVRTGSAYENQSESSPANETGAVQFLELSAFRSTAQRPNPALVEEMNLLGGMMQCIASKENIIYILDVMRHRAEQAFDILADTTLNPSFPAEELEECRAVVELQKTELPSEIFSRDLVQRAAYIGSPLGNHHYCPTELSLAMDKSKLDAFRAQNFFPGNCIVAVAGLDHESAVELANKKFGHFVDARSVTEKTAPRIRQRDGLDMVAKSRYTGGMLFEERELKEPFVKMAIAYEIGGWSDPMLVPTCVLQMLLGGGSSFSAGGPGKGMFSRLYTQVLNKHYWAESVESFLAIHEHAGLLGIDGACPPENLPNLVQVIVQQFSTLALVPVSEEELARAKNMLKSSMMMQLESRLVQCEDIARQFVTYGHRDSQAKMCAKIDAVTAQDLMAVATRMMTQLPSVGAVGSDLSKLPKYEHIAAYSKAYYEQMLKTKAGKFSASGI